MKKIRNKTQKRTRISGFFRICLAALLIGLMLQGEGTYLLSARATAGNEGDELTGAKEDLQGSKNELADIKKELNAIKANRKTAAKRLESLKADQKSMQAYIKELDQNLAEVVGTIAQLDEGIALTETQIQVTREELADARESGARQYEAMKLRVQYMYENREIQYLELLLQSKSFTDFLNRIEYISAIVAYDKDMKEAYRQTCEEIAEKEQTLEAEYAELAELRQVNEEIKTDLEELVKAKEKELAAFQKKINEAAAQVSALDKEADAAEEAISAVESSIKAQEAYIKKLEEEAIANGNVSNGYPALIWPVKGYSRISSYFGNRKEPVAGVGTFHKGIDIPAPSGTKIGAAAAGTVITSTYHYSAGNYVVLYHGNGFCTIYMHCSKLLVKVGDKVEQGQTVGLVGTTGYSTGNHLHFGVRIDDVYKNPLDYVAVP